MVLWQGVYILCRERIPTTRCVTWKRRLVPVESSLPLHSPKKNHDLHMNRTLLYASSMLCSTQEVAVKWWHGGDQLHRWTKKNFWRWVRLVDMEWFTNISLEHIKKHHISRLATQGFVMSISNENFDTGGTGGAIFGGNQGTVPVKVKKEFDLT